MEVLLIDDDPINNIVNHKLLKKHNASLNIHEFLSAKKALEYLETHRNNPPNLILLDINMPVMNGWQFLDIYKNMNIPSTLFLLTSSIAHEDMSKAKTYSVVKDFLIKPLEDHKIRKVLSL